jgi:hypothetical protein
VAIRSVNAITGAGCVQAQEASRDRQLPASGIVTAPAATQGERNGKRQHNTFGADRLGRGVVGGSITRGVARDFQFCTATLVVQRSGSGATFVGAV